VTGLLGARILGGLTSLFNFLALNLVLLIASFPLVTLPVAASAATAALDHWRLDGEDRVVTEFLRELRRQPGRRTLEAGVPIAAIVLGLAEVRHFARDGGPAARVALGLGLAALLITLTAVGYVLLLGARSPAGPGGARRPATEFWSLAVSLALRNILVTGPLFLAELAAAAAVTVIDPPLLLLGVPLALLQLMRLTAQLGLRRTQQSQQHSQHRKDDPWHTCGMTRRPGPGSSS
jgi:hypothetical protein